MLIPVQRPPFLSAGINIQDTGLIDWGVSNGSVATYTSAAPASGAIEFTESTATNLHNVNDPISGIDAGMAYTFSCYIKPLDTRQYCLLRLYGNDFSFSNYIHANYDLSGISVTATTSAGTGSYSSSAITDEGSGWCRISIVGTPGSGSTDGIRLTIGGSNSSAIAGRYYTGSASERYAICGAKIEVGTTLTNYAGIR